MDHVRTLKSSAALHVPPVNCGSLAVMFLRKDGYETPSGESLRWPVGANRVKQIDTGIQCVSK